MYATKVPQTPTATPKRNGKPVELGRYETEGGERRVLVGRRLEGKVRVYDAPLRRGQGRIFLVEPRVDNYRELAALVHDYKGEADRYGQVPMAWTFVDRALVAKAEDLL